MAWKIPQEYVQDGDIVEPSELRINVNEFISELNGFLDSDNIGKEQIDRRLVKRGAFTEVYSQNNVGPIQSFVFNHEHAGWLDKADGYQHAEAHGGYVAEPHRNTLGASAIVYNQELPRIEFDANQDGLLICEYSGWVQWLQQSTHSDFMDDDPFDGYQVGTYSYYGKQTKKYKLKASYVLCSMWRITVNGMSVCETGPIGNEYEAHPLYLCGAIPIVKGNDTIVKLEGQFVWYSPGNDNYISASSWAPRFEVSATNTWRRDCALHNSQLITTYRKR